MLTSYQKLRHFCLKLCSLGNIVEHCCKALIVAPPPHCWKLLISTQFHEPKVPSPPQWNNSCPFCTVFRTSANFRTFRCHDVGGRDPDVQFSDSEACRQEEIPLRRPQQRPPGDKNEQKINSLPPEVNNNSNNNKPTNNMPWCKHQTLKLLSF